MRCSLTKLKVLLLIVCLNLILVPTAVRYLTCPNFEKAGIYKMNMVAYFENEKSKQPLKRNCKPKKNMVFLKTHKTGGSTITNILNRYGESHDFTFILPRIGENRLDWPWFFQKDSFYPLNGSEPNILNNHARYNRDVIEKLMPNDTVYFTILRNPITQFESSFSYMTLDKILGMRNSTDPLEEFFKDPEQILVNYVLTQDLRINSDRLKLIRNGMSYDLGLESKDFDNQERIKENIAKLDRDFDLVMITEYFEESIILLKKLLCWELDDVVYFLLKQRSSELKRKISIPLQKKISQWSSADVKLYKHFNSTFWTVLKTMGKEYWDEVKLLKTKNEAMADLCLQPMRHLSAELIQTAETKQYKLRSNIPYNVREMCRRMTWDEIKYLKYLRQLHIEKIERSNKKTTIIDSINWFSNKLQFNL